MFRTATVWTIALLLTPAPAVAQTAPIVTAEPLTRIAFGSCADDEKPQPIWEAVLAARPELFVFTGDNVYGDVEGGKRISGDDAAQLAGLAASYKRAAEIPGFKALRASVPHLATWDDHDFGKNDGGADFGGKAEAKQQFLSFWNVPADDPRRTREGIYSATIYGKPGQQVQVILLDTRTFRSPLKPTDQKDAPGKERYVPDEDASKTMLGAEQWAWLEAELQKPADVRIIVSSIQFLAEGHGWERWGNLPLERKKMIELIAKTGANGVVFVSGDRHIGALYKETTGVPYPFYEMTASGLTQYWATNAEPGPNRLGSIYGKPNFGVIEIDWWAGSLRLTLRDDSGQIVRSETVFLNTLTAMR